MDYTGQKFLQNCGDYLIIDKKSDKKERTRYLWEAHFEGYTKKLYVRQDNFSRVMYITQKNQINMDFFVMKKCR